MPGTTMGPPRGADSVYLSDRTFQDILPPIPNLQVGYLYSFGNSVRSGRLTLDYLLPVNLTTDSTIFGEAHTEFHDFWKTLTGSANHRVDLSFGAGFRRILRGNTLVGINGFYDSTRLGGVWYSSGSLGLEMAALLPGNDAIDLNFNWYGRLFSGSVISDAFRYGPANFDIVAGYSHELFDEGPDLRLYGRGYKFSTGNSVYGGNAGVELKTRGGVFVVKYEVGHDKINKTYHTVGGFVNVGIQLSNLLSGESPFVMPEPIFRSPRNLRRMLTRSASSTRNFSQPAAVVVARSVDAGGAGFAAIVVTAPIAGRAPMVTQVDPCPQNTWRAFLDTVVPPWAPLSSVVPSGSIDPAGNGNVQVTVSDISGAGVTSARVNPILGDSTTGAQIALGATPPPGQNIPAGGTATWVVAITPAHQATMAGWTQVDQLVIDFRHGSAGARSVRIFQDAIIVTLNQ